MLHFLRFSIRFPLVFLWIFFGILVMSVLYPFCKRKGRTALNRWWSRQILRLCGVQTKVSGQPILDGTALWVGNHVSWKDIFILSRVRAACYVAKSDIAKWPIIGRLVTMAGTVYIDRSNRKDVIRVGQLMAERLAEGEIVAFFPEGTTTDGFDVLQFRGGLLQVAVDHPLPIQPVVLHYYYQGKRSSYAAYIGEQTLLQNLWYVLGASGIAIDVDFLEPMVFGPEAHKTRYEIANELEAIVRRRLQERQRLEVR